MSHTATAAIELPAIPPPVPTPTAAELRAELAALIEEDLLLRFKRAAPKDRIAIETTAILAAGLRHLIILFRPGCDPEVPPLLLGHRKRLTDWLFRLGTDRIAGTLAENALRDAIAIEDAVLASLPAAGNA